MSGTDSLKICKSALEDLKAKDILTLKIGENSSFAEWLVIASATSNRHAKALAEKLVDALKVHNKKIIGVEGRDNAEWVLIDCGDIVINIMQQEIRDFYDLESLWGDQSLLIVR
jgi:ribosome-associated protein|tara:strand:- start:28573 stop:28914 length:342 start_codon:yes stop_codon:yes gene_type:complete